MVSRIKQTPLQAAFIGAGVINFGSPYVPWSHADRLESLGAIKVKAIVDIDLKKAADVLKVRQENPEYGHLYSECNIYKSTADMLRDNLDLDVVFIGTPPSARGSLAMGRDLELQCAQQGIDVFVEKPLSMSPPEEFKKYSDLLLSSCRDNGIILSVGYVFRYHAAVMKTKELIAKHGGKVMSFDVKYSRSYTHLDMFHRVLNQQTGPGLIVELGTHLVDLARYIVGEVNEDSIHTIHVRDTDPGNIGQLKHLPEGGENDIEPAKRVPRVTSSHWKFESGGVGSFLANVGAPGSCENILIEIHLDGLKISISNIFTFKKCVLKVRDMDSLDSDILYTFEDHDHFLCELDYFIQAVLSRDQSLIRSNYEDAKKSYDLTWAIRRAGEQYSP